MTNKILGFAGVLSLALTAVHVFAGGPDVHEPLLASNAPDVIKGFASVIWHAITFSLLMCSCLLFIAAIRAHLADVLTSIVIVYYVGVSGLFVFYGLTRFGNVMLMPPWIGFLVIASVAGVGLRVAANRRGKPA